MVSVFDPREVAMTPQGQNHLQWSQRRRSATAIKPSEARWLADMLEITG